MSWPMERLQVGCAGAPEGNFPASFRTIPIGTFPVDSISHLNHLLSKCFDIMCIFSAYQPWSAALWITFLPSSKGGSHIFL